jgi:HD superfamily phosphohydrolase YqeK
MSEYEGDMIKLTKQIAEDLRWLRCRAEEHDWIKQHEDEQLLELIEKTHRGPKKKQRGISGK